MQLSWEFSPEPGDRCALLTPVNRNLRGATAVVRSKRIDPLIAPTDAYLIAEYLIAIASVEVNFIHHFRSDE